MESKQNDRAEELARLAYGLAIDDIKKTNLSWIVEHDEELGQLDDAEKILTVALARALLDKVVDLSGWAVSMGADGMEPFHGALSIELGDDRKPMVRVHVAFAPEFEPQDRVDFVMELGKLINENV